MIRYNISFYLVLEFCELDAYCQSSEERLLVPDSLFLLSSVFTAEISR